MTSDLNDNSNPLPFVHFNQKKMPETNQFEVWQDLTSELFSCSPLTDSKSYSFSSSCYQVEDLVFTHVAFDSQLFRRTPRQIYKNESDFILLQFYKQGQQQGLINNQFSFVNNSSIVSIQDLAHCYTAIGESQENYGVLIPRHLITVHDELYLHTPFVSYSVDSFQGRTILNHLSAIWQELPTATQAEASFISSSFIGLLNGILTVSMNSSISPSQENANFRAMKNYLIANLQDLDLDVQQLCEKFNCSRSKVYRLFQTTGGIKNFLQEQRLARCYQELQQGSSRIKVQQIAGKWGFLDLSYFSKLFKKHYSIAPSELLKLSQIASVIKRKQTPLVKSQYYNQIERFKTWII
jgi:AraC-like DNA-binding protein